MHKEEIDKLIRAKPFAPFEVRMVDGQKYRFRSPEQLIVSRSAILTLDKNNDVEIISLVMIASVHVRNRRNGRSRKKK